MATHHSIPLLFMEYIPQLMWQHIRKTLSIGEANDNMKNMILKSSYGLRYTTYRGFAQVSSWVRLKFAAMNLKKFTVWEWRERLSSSLLHSFLTFSLSISKGMFRLVPEHPFFRQAGSPVLRVVLAFSFSLKLFSNCHRKTTRCFYIK